MLSQLRPIIAGIKQDYLRDLIESVFVDFGRILGYLDQVRESCQANGSIEEALLLLEAVRSEGLALAACVDQQRAELELPVELDEEMERIGFAITHEVKIAYSKIIRCEQADARRTIADAQEVLRNCFQELTAMLAQVFDPVLERAILFDEVRERRENSRELYEDLNALLRSARHAEGLQDYGSIGLFSERFEHLQSGSVRYLMQKDRETCQNFAADFEELGTSGSLKFFLHRFSCYLEILIKHVRMRSVLADDFLEAAA